MRASLMLSLVLLLGLFLPATVSAQPMDYASVGINPSYQEAAPGAQLAFTVSGSSTQGGTVSVSIEAGLTLAGDPTCSGPCRGPFVTGNTDTTGIEVTLDGQVATFGFTVTVSPSANIGDSLDINAILVGGPQAVEMSSALVSVVESVPTHAPPGMPNSGSSSIPDNRLFYLGISPTLLRLAPGGEVLYHVQPVRWGMWSGPGPNVDLQIDVPAGLIPSFEPYCGRGDLIPMQHSCAAKKSEGNDGGITYVINLGYNTPDGSANGVYLVLRAANDVKIGSLLQVKASATVDDKTLAKQPQQVESNILVVSKKSLLTPQFQGGTVGATLEATRGFTKSRSTCSPTPSSSQIGLFEYGLQTKFASATVGTGMLGIATNGSGAEVCLIPITFADVPLRSLYILATSFGEDMPCRACVYGLITTSQNGEAVFPSQQ